MSLKDEYDAITIRYLRRDDLSTSEIVAELLDNLSAVVAGVIVSGSSNQTIQAKAADLFYKHLKECIEIASGRKKTIQ